MDQYIFELQDWQVGRAPKGARRLLRPPGRALPGDIRERQNQLDGQTGHGIKHLKVDRIPRLGSPQRDVAEA
ncbi:hypothetical protein BST63_11945 [Bradyrhizobium canariense]|uniref:Uncharacterized protein n=1 Tax=Bradyrhizobium canariense TaxID=255045 RepID=A0ABX3X5D1_9BRAD|nr:hypothetical protein BSR47_04850 [Bradyrhizobium canariense]OSJ30492.1 hypothetical protein BST63_11945 [Bradyrhizobium canariense]